MKRYPSALSIAGSDSSGGAGIQADLKTFSSLGVYGMTAITAITAQNSMGVNSVLGVAPEMVSAQIDAIFDDIMVDAVKLGMLFSQEIIDIIADRIEVYKPKNIILDPVMISTSGHRLISEGAIDSLISKLIPLASIVTPNKHEAELLSGITIEEKSDIHKAGNKILATGAKSVLIKGGHFEGEIMTDYLFIGETVLEFSGAFIDTVNTHGTGCTLSSAIAAFLALGLPLRVAVGKAKAYLEKGLTSGASIKVGNGHGPLNHLHDPVCMNIIKGE